LKRLWIFLWVMDGSLQSYAAKNDVFPGKKAIMPFIREPIFNGWLPSILCR
jgi:hypothetical protein